MYDSMKDKQITVPDVIEKWGVPPEKMIDLQAMTGDSTDNVPGIPGIGPKTAAQLLEEYGDLDTLLARAGEIKQQKRRESIIANADLARLSRELVTLKKDTPLDVPPEDFRLDSQDGPKLIAFLKAMEFTTLTRRVAAATDTDAEAIEPAHVPVEWGAQAHGPDLDVGEAGGPPPSPQSSSATPPRGNAARAAVSFLSSGQDADTTGATPTGLAEARAAYFGKAPFDHSGCRTIRDIDTLERWIADAREAGLVGSIPRRRRPTPCAPTSSAFRSRSPITRTTPRARGSGRPTCRSPIRAASATSWGVDLSTARSRSGRP